MPPPAAPPAAVLDANVLYPQFLRDVLLRLAAAEMFSPRWSDRIQREWSRNLAANRPDIPIARIDRLRQLMERAFPAARVAGYRAHEALFPDVDATTATWRRRRSRADRTGSQPPILTISLPR